MIIIIMKKEEKNMKKDEKNMKNNRKMKNLKKKYKRKNLYLNSFNKKIDF